MREHVHVDILVASVPGRSQTRLDVACLPDDFRREWPLIGVIWAEGKGYLYDVHPLSCTNIMSAYNDRHAWKKHSHRQY